MVNKNILKVRKKLDKLDNSLLNIIKKRTKLVDIVKRIKNLKKILLIKKEYQSYLKIFQKI